MGDTQFGTNDPRTQKVWSKKTFEYALAEMFLMNRGLMGVGANYCIQILSDLERKPGDACTVEMEAPLVSEGVGEDGNATEHAEALTVLNQTITINERAHAVRSKGAMSEKRTATDIREAGRRQLGIWIGNIAMEPDLMRCLYGLYNASGIATVNEKTPSSARIWRGGQTAAGVIQATSSSIMTVAALSALTATDALCGLKVLEQIRRMAELCTPMITPLQVKGYDQPVYPVLLHPYQLKAIKNETGAAGYAALMAAAQTRGNQNPLFTGAEIFYDGLVIYKYLRAPMRTGLGTTTPAEGFELNAARTITTDPVATGKSVARGILLGKAAAAILHGKRPAWSEDFYDNDKPQVKIDMIYGVSKIRFNEFTIPNTNTVQQDLGVFTFDTQVIVDS